MLRVFGYLKFHHSLGISLASPVSTFPTFASVFDSRPWRKQYPNAHEDIPSDAPVALGRPVHLTVHVDAAHASNSVNRRSVTGFFVLVNPKRKQANVVATLSHNNPSKTAEETTMLLREQVLNHQFEAVKK